MLETILLLPPLLGALVAGFGRSAIGARAAMGVAIAMTSFVLLVALGLYLSFDGFTTVTPLFLWIESASFTADWALRVDRVSLVFALLAILGTLLAQGQAWFDHSEAEGEPTGIAAMSLMLFVLISLIFADNLLQLIFGVIGISFCSYLLIGTDTRRARAGKSASRLGVFHGLGDFLILLSAICLFALSDSLNFDDLFDPVMAGLIADQDLILLFTQANALVVSMMLLVLGLIIKAGQFGFHILGLDQDIAPLPAQILISTLAPAVMVAIILLRFAPLIDLSPMVSQFLIFFGLLSAIALILIALAQTELRRMLAVMAAAHIGILLCLGGAGAGPSLVSYSFAFVAFHTALLLVASHLITGAEGRSDLRVLKATGHLGNVLIIIALSATAVGLPFVGIGFGGYGAIFHASTAIFELGLGNVAWVLILIFLTLNALAVWSLVFQLRADKTDADIPPKLSFWVVLLPGTLLSALLSLVLFPSFYSGSEAMQTWFGEALQLSQNAPSGLLASLASVAVVAGIGLAYFLSRQEDDVATRMSPLKDGFGIARLYSDWIGTGIATYSSALVQWDRGPVAFFNKGKDDESALKAPIAAGSIILVLIGFVLIIRGIA